MNHTRVLIENCLLQYLESYLPCEPHNVDWTLDFEIWLEGLQLHFTRSKLYNSLGYHHMEDIIVST